MIKEKVMMLLKSGAEKKEGIRLYLWGCAIGLFLSLVLVYYSCIGINFIYSKIFILILFLLVLLPLFFEAQRRRLELFEPLILAFLGISIYFIFPAIDLSFLYRLIDPSIHLSHYGGLSPERDFFLAKVILFSIIGVFMFYFGYYLNLGKKIGSLMPIPGSTFSRRKLLIAGIFYIMLGVIFFIYTAWKIGGTTKWFTTPKGENVFLVAQSVYSSFALNIFIPAIIVLFGYALIRRNKFIFLLWSGLSISFVIFYNLFSSGSRRITLLLILSLIIFYHYGIKPIRLKKIVLITLILFLFNLSVGFIRGTIHQYNLEAVKDQMVKLTSALIHKWHNPVIMTMDFPYCYNTLMQLVDYVPEEVDYLWGSTYAKFFFWPIPRSYWPEKPEGITRVTVYHFSPDMYEKGVSMSPTIIGEAYFNFGLLGIISVMAIFGVVCKAFRIFIQKNKGNIGSIAVYASVAPYVFESFRGYLFECTALYLFIVVTVFMAFFFARIKKKDSI